MLLDKHEVIELVRGLELIFKGKVKIEAAIITMLGKIHRLILYSASFYRINSSLIYLLHIDLHCTSLSFAVKEFLKYRNASRIMSFIWFL